MKIEREVVGVPAPVAFDPLRAREDFPILRERVRGKPLAYLDNAASTQKPAAVIETLGEFYRHDYANVHRGVHALSQRATDRYEAARETVRRFLNAGSAREIVFVRGTTEAINLVAQSFGRARFGAGDEVVLSAIEHHSNIVSWQLACAAAGARIRVIPVDERGELDLHAYEKLLGPRTRLVAVTHMSNAIGTIPPVRGMIALAHERGVPVLVDGAQAVSHLPVDVRDLDCDFYAFSGHKVYGPTGIGVLYAKSALLEEMPPWQGGGDMIRTVTFEKTEYAQIPAKFEAGTPDIAGAVGLAAALDYLSAFDRAAVAAHERDLLEYATRRLSEIPGLAIVGTAAEKASIVSFTLEGMHPHDVGTILDDGGVAIRAGHHCAMPLMQRYGIPGTARASFALYNTRADVDALVAGVEEARRLFA
ncbi:MAG TPA: cysteine desulfurase [Usitatibacter sp.]